MTFRKGAALTTSATLGNADTADGGPTAGNGFRTRWPEDLAALQDLGLTDVRIALDWARLQPKPGTFDADWAERFEQILQAADAIGVRPWACLHESSIPRWFDNDGGFGNDETFTTWWPRWVERAAERFGDLVGGWVPFACIPAGAPDQPWLDTWGILAGGPPVAAAVDLRERAGTVSRYADTTDLLGAVLSGDWTADDAIDATALARAADRWGGELREAADATDSALMISGFSAGHGDDDIAGEVVGALRSVLDDAVDDGVPIEVAFIEPGIAGPDSPPGLLDADRAPTPSSAAFLD
ncbi:MAG TPA: family 1 glycosylhydrolase [Ilumatobacteraceae bacterium]|nr:family 1 glycosylhydrolase [Ilumatobacteraceae bacterium]